MSTKAERDHIAKQGANYRRALALAAMSIHRNGKLVGARKVREAMAHAAALKATGFAVPVFEPPAGAGAMTQETQAMIAAEFATAVEAANGWRHST